MSLKPDSAVVVDVIQWASAAIVATVQIAIFRQYNYEKYWQYAELIHVSFICVWTAIVLWAIASAYKEWTGGHIKPVGAVSLHIVLACLGLVAVFYSIHKYIQYGVAI